MHTQCTRVFLTSFLSLRASLYVPYCTQLRLDMFVYLFLSLEPRKFNDFNFIYIIGHVCALAHATAVWHWLRFKLNYLNFLLSILLMFISSVLVFICFFFRSRLGVHVFLFDLLVSLSWFFLLFRNSNACQQSNNQKKTSFFIFNYSILHLYFCMCFFFVMKIINWNVRIKKWNFSLRSK